MFANKFPPLTAYLLCLCSLGIFSAKANAAWVEDTQNIMGTRISISFWHDSAAIAQRALADGMAEMRRIDQTLSPYIETSDLALLNKNAAAAPQAISDELLFLVDKSLYYSRLSDGAFDITFASLGWFYDYRNKLQPSVKQRDKLLPAINYKWLQLNPKQKTLRFLHPNVRIDLGGIAKGYAVDRVIDILKGYGVEHATVSAGGDSRVLGDKGGRPWMVGIKNPRDGGDESAAPVIRLPLENVAISTSGDYERYFIDDQGHRVHHIINPKTGESASGLVSVTILGPQGADTDPLSTTVFVLGVEKGLALINQLRGFDAILIDSKGTVFYSDGLLAPEAAPATSGAAS